MKGKKSQIKKSENMNEIILIPELDETFYPSFDEAYLSSSSSEDGDNHQNKKTHKRKNGSSSNSNEDVKKKRNKNNILSIIVQDEDRNNEDAKTSSCDEKESKKLLNKASSTTEGNVVAPLADSFVAVDESAVASLKGNVVIPLTDLFLAEDVSIITSPINEANLDFQYIAPLPKNLALRRHSLPNDLSKVKFHKSDLEVFDILNPTDSKLINDLSTSQMESVLCSGNGIIYLIVTS
jgi:hypothetical protein